MKVLIVEDSPTVRQLLRYILEQAGMEIIAEAANGREALELLKMRRPDVITMDIHMPEMDGIETTRRIMEENPLPIVVVSASHSVEEGTVAMQILEAGAVTVVQKPGGPGAPYHERDAQILVKAVRYLSEVKLVRRYCKKNGVAPAVSPQLSNDFANRHPQLVAVGASTGGPVALKDILLGLNAEFPWPMLVVQHISPGFLAGFCEWLNRVSRLPVAVARQGEKLLAGHVYLAPDSYHMQVANPGVIKLVAAPPVNGLRPAVSPLFSSVLRCYGDRCVAILLSGMGRDGAAELLQLKSQGALTLVQDAESVVVNGMPGAAVKLGAASYVMPPEKMASLLNDLAIQQYAERPEYRKK